MDPKVKLYWLFVLLNIQIDNQSEHCIFQIMVTMVVILTTLVVTVFYVCVLPHIYYQTELFWVLVHLVFSHWLLINIIFNYFMASFTVPGHPPQVKSFLQFGEKKKLSVLIVNFQLHNFLIFSVINKSSFSENLSLFCLSVSIFSAF